VQQRRSKRKRRKRRKWKIRREKQKKKKEEKGYVGQCVKLRCFWKLVAVVEVKGEREEHGDREPGENVIRWGNERGHWWSFSRGWSTGTCRFG
jgi:hypothetical protein